MAKPRMCFALLYSEEKFYLSRNFKLQEVGNFDWLMDNYDFSSIIQSIDELLILNVTFGRANPADFLKNIKLVVKNCFMPVAIGGGIRTMDDARLLFESGADKVVLNTAFFTTPSLVSGLVDLYGSQSVVASLDFRRDANSTPRIYIDGGRTNTGISLVSAVEQVEKLGAGELFLTSIDRDGTGMGFDIPALGLAHSACKLPIIASGGADTADRLAEGLQSGFATGVATAHLFNFMCDGLYDAREELIAKGIPLSRWNFEQLNQDSLNNS